MCRQDLTFNRSISTYLFLILPNLDSTSPPPYTQKLIPQRFEKMLSHTAPFPEVKSFIGSLGNLLSILLSFSVACCRSNLFSLFSLSQAAKVQYSSNHCHANPVISLSCKSLKVQPTERGRLIIVALPCLFNNRK